MAVVTHVLLGVMDFVLFDTSMKRTSLLAIISTIFLTFLVSCADPPPNPAQARVASMAERRSVGKQRVVAFPEVRDETNGTAAEHAWTQAQFPDYKWNSRELLEDGNGRIYHRIILSNARGHEVTVYFDITEWFDRL